ncbi:E3 ubiquitin-protein ligase UBR4 isoform X1 [Rhopalosiphum maidis]|uniref:E3 ubiquitin-protein ligase UBR4 isoform X1 n=1 Tax=Rhopalosiphum maidis TaxID=43146 RepID=UPI000EFE286B|nr:E3 ubiquitin-protein ligase UBR4 isoform X1 [Rhopalosiphum maidis]
MASKADLDWTSVKFVFYDTGSNAKVNLYTLLKFIDQSEKCLSEHDINENKFYFYFVTLAANYIGHHCNLFEKNELSTVSKSCKILLKCLLSYMGQVNANDNNWDSYSSHLNLALAAISALCSGKPLNSSEFVSVVMCIKEWPSNNASTFEEKEKESKKSLAYSSIAEQMIRPLDRSKILLKDSSKKDEKDIKKLLIKNNISALQEMGANNVIFKTCTKLPILKRYITENQLNSTEEQNIQHSIESTGAKFSYRFVLLDMTFVENALALPIFEPLTIVCLQQLTSIMAACLRLALFVQSVHNNSSTSTDSINIEDDVMWNQAVQTIEKTVIIIQTVSDILKKFSYSVHQNYYMIAIWILINGLQDITLKNYENNSIKDGKVTKTKKETSKPLAKNSFNVLSVALANEMLTMIVDLLENARKESSSDQLMKLIDFESEIIPAPLDICAKARGCSRLLRIFQTVPLIKFLYQLAAISHRKVMCLVLNKNKNKVNGIRTTSLESIDMLPGTPESGAPQDGDEDNESLFGAWFEEVLTLGDQQIENACSKTQTSDYMDLDKSVLNQSNYSVVPENDDPEGYLALIIRIFNILDIYFLNAECNYIFTYMSKTIETDNIIVLAKLVGEVDWAPVNNDLSSIVDSHQNVSSSIGIFIHNLIAKDFLSGKQQDEFLELLGIKIPQDALDSKWSLQIYPRTLSILAQVLLKKPITERDELSMFIWQNMINALGSLINRPRSSNDDFEDLNVEHTQLLIFLFNLMSLTHKKGILLAICNTIIGANCVLNPVYNNHILALSRLLLLFDYLVRRLYDVPEYLLSQVEWNLMRIKSEIKVDGDEVLTTDENTYMLYNSIEENLRRRSDSVGNSAAVVPCFYKLLDDKQAVNDAPKLDGLALNFILNHPEKLSYPQLIQALLNITRSLNLYKESFVDDNGIENKTVQYSNPLTLCSIEYCFTLAWKLLLSLPVPIQKLQDMLSDKSGYDTSDLLYFLIWGPRTGSKIYYHFLKEGVYKQICVLESNENNKDTDSLSSRELLSNVATAASLVKYEYQIAKTHFIQQLCQTDALKKNCFPMLLDCILFDAVLSKVYLQTRPGKTPEECPKVANSELIQTLLPYCIELAMTTFTNIKNNLLHQISNLNQTQKFSVGDLTNLKIVLSMANNNSPLDYSPITYNLPTLLYESIPSWIVSILTKWNSVPVGPVVKNPSLDSSPENLILNIIKHHSSFVSSQSVYMNTPSLKRLLNTLVVFITENIQLCTDYKLRSDYANLLSSMTIDCSSEYLLDHIIRTWDKLKNPGDQDPATMISILITKNIRKLAIQYKRDDTTNTDYLTEKVLIHSLFWIEQLIFDFSSVRYAVLQTFCEKTLKEGISMKKFISSGVFIKTLVRLTNRLFSNLKISNNQDIKTMCRKIIELSTDPKNRLDLWLQRIIVGWNKDKDLIDATSTLSRDLSAFLSDKHTNSLKDVINNISASIDPDDNFDLIKNMIDYIVGLDTNDELKTKASLCYLETLIPIVTYTLAFENGDGFSKMFAQMVRLADYGGPSGHVKLFKASVKLLDSIKNWLKSNMANIEITEPKQSYPPVVIASSCLMNYVSDIIAAVQHNDVENSVSPSLDSMSLFYYDGMEFDGFLPSNDGDGETLNEDSDEDSLYYRLCTFTVTQKEFMNQHWYHCHTCKMIEGVGVCSICAKVCHRGHDVTYAKFGNFFCDCGAKENNFCQALVKRNPNSILDANNSRDKVVSNEGGNSVADQDRIDGYNTSASNHNQDPRNMSTRSLDYESVVLNSLPMSYKNVLMPTILDHSQIIEPTLDLCLQLINVVIKSGEKNSAIGCNTRAVDTLNDLQELEKTIEVSDSLMLPTMGSQEGAFENVKMNFSGDQGQTIRQLLSAHMIRRVAMCCLSSLHGKRQHLVAVSHDKGKIAVLQMSSLLKQSDISKRKLTLTRLSSVSIPFTVLSVTANSVNEDFLSVCGLKDCHILTFNTSGTINEHIVLHPTLEVGNFIIRSIWLPGSQTSLALVSAEFVKIYDLSKDVLSPQYYFLVPTGKIRDVTFMCTEEKSTMILISSGGYIYTQDMDASSSAVHGPFYVTNTIDIVHPDISDVNGQVCGGGVSVYYSHTLSLLMFSYVTPGRTFIAPLDEERYQGGVITLHPVFAINSQTLSPSAKNKNNINQTSTSTPPTQPMWQWSEVPGHPGLVCAILQSSNTPVVFMITPKVISLQEIKLAQTKTKITDMVAVRHPLSNGDYRTTLIILCEDGSLRMFLAAKEQTDFWLSPSIQPSCHITSCKLKKKKINKSGKSTGNTSSFPIDFFEYCVAMNEIEFGGNDLLQIYNPQQIKHRLNSNGMYVVSTKPRFSIEITNNDATTVMAGIRINVGGQDIGRAPGYIEVLGRTLHLLPINRSRWFDFPLTREESLQSDKKLTIVFGPSRDPEGVTMIDSIKLYGKTKESFGWPDEVDEISNGTIYGSTSTSTVVTSNQFNPQEKELPLTGFAVNHLDKFIIGLLTILENSFIVSNYALNDENEQYSTNKTKAVNIALQLLNHSTQACIQLHSKSLVAVLQPEYHTFKDQSMLNYILKTLHNFERDDPKNMDAEAYYRLVLITRGITVSRPQHLSNFEYTHHEGLDYNNEQSPQWCQPLIQKLISVFWILYYNRPKNPSYCTIYVPGLKHTEAVVYALIEILHSLLFFECSGFQDSQINTISKYYLDFLLCEDVAVSYTAKLALSRALKPQVFGKNNQNLVRGDHSYKEPVEVKEISSKGTENEEQVLQESPDENMQYEVDEPIILLDPRVEPQEHDRQNMEVLIGNVQFPGLIIPPDADDDAMVELAIALSLQDNDGIDNNAELQNIRQGLQQGFVELQGLNAPATLQNIQENSSQNNDNGQSSETQSMQQGHLSDTTASAAGSDDEDTNAVPGSSNLRTSPTDNSQNERGEIDEEIIFDQDLEINNHLHTLRLSLLEKFINHIPNLHNIGGTRAIPFFQVVSSIVADMDLNNEGDKEYFTELMQMFITYIRRETLDDSNLHIRNSQREIVIIIMRFIGVLLARPKSSSKSSSDHTTYISQTAASMLKHAQFITCCLKALKALQEYWASFSDNDDNSANVVSVLLEPSGPSRVPDMSPFFLKPYSVSQTKDIFHNYPIILTEMLLRLPYQIQKSWSQLSFEPEWLTVLCEFMSLKTINPFIKRQVRKLLLFVCGNKDKYRQIRDMHALSTSMKNFQVTCDIGDQNTSLSLNLTYDKLVELVEDVKVCVDIASSRMLNWQLYCRKDNTVLLYLMRAACFLDEGVSSTILHLLQYAICGAKNQSGTPSGKESKSKVSKVAEDIENAMLEEAQCMILVKEMNKRLNKDILTRFVKTFLLETNSTHIRWQAHALVLSIYRNSEHDDQEKLLELLWALWPQLPTYGRKASQFVDLLGYFSFKYNQKAATSTKYVEQAIELLRTQNYKLACHPNANLYTQISQYVDLEGFYLESEPCMVCNNPEIPFTNIKLTSIKVDSKFTTTTQIVKLMGSHTINKIVLRITDLKRTKMVRTMNIFYNNRYVQAVVELKNKPAMWHKAKEITLTSGQTEVKVEFAVPIVAWNLLIEYSSFYENLHASSETLQCPRCSATVPSNPGVCSNCGENVFQCHKCRAINYDEKDPFLCHSCGFCKYAKFDYVLTAKPCCAVDPIEDDHDRNKTISSINTNLEKADRLYKQLVSSKPVLENMLVKVMENRLEKSNNTNAEESQSPNVVPVSGFAAVVNGAMNNNISSGPVHQVNRSIQLLAQKYGSECRNTFEDLSRIVQKVLASRKELIAYDQKQLGQVKSTIRFNGSISSLSVSDSLVSISQNTSSACSLPNTSCYGCITAALEHCFVMLRALATNMTLRKILLQQGLIQELVENNIRRGSVQTQEEVRNLLCILIQDNQKATEDLCGLLSQRISLTIRGPIANADLAFAVRPEISLLATMLYKEDSCWEQKAKCVMQLFFMTCKEFQSSAIVTYITLPCLKMMRNIIKPPASSSKANKDKSTDVLSTVQMSDNLMVDFRKWAKQSPEHMFNAWRQRLQKKIPSDTPVKNKPKSKNEIRQYYLASKYFKKWRLYSLRDIAKPFHLTESSWLKHFLFCSSTRLLRQVACAIFEGIAQVPERKKEILDLLTGFLTELGNAGENCAEFLGLYQNLIQQTPWKQYLALRGVLIMISDIITKEIKHLHYLEETTLTSDLAQGFVLKSLTGLLASFLEVESIKQQYKGRLVGAILNGYLSLRRLVVQRTRLIDETQSQLLDLLEEMTCGTETESKAFMAICVETVEKCDIQDVRTPVFVFERLCSIIYPEENDVGEFYMNLDKDPQQEDFLQGRMLGNPYSCNESGLGPLMRDVKNKICQDCELVALLEDDNGMELLVNNKIISLDLPVKEVYKKIWLPEGGDNEAAMHIVYRMRGLLGDATEEFIETLDAKSDQEVNNEEVYKMANVMAECRGLRVLMYRLSTIKDLSRSRPLLEVLLKLLGLCVKVKHNQEILTEPMLGSIPILLNTLELCLSNEADGLSNTSLTEQTLDILETILSKATSKGPEAFATLSETFGPDDHIRYLLHCASNARYTIVQHLTRVLAALTYNNKAKMIILMDHFASVISDFEKFDDVHSAQDEQMMNLFCDLTYGIENNSLGNTLKDYILSLGVINNVIQYISRHAPTVKSTLNKNNDKDEWKEFISKPSLKYILRFWTGLANGHEPTQTAVSDECIHTVHCLEQVSSDEHVGSLAENLLEALKTNPKMAEKIEQVREQTKAEKKRLAMAMRQKQLGQLGMRTNEKGQVTAETSLLQQVEDLGEETGLVCVICREGYKFQPTKVLGIYTFTKRCVVEEHEVKARKTIGYSTVTHFNVVHFDCHMSAVRLARVRDEWESAALQNANTKCNGLLPMWGPSVAESAYANCLARHNSYLQEATGQRDISYMQTVHDLKLLLFRFAQAKSFHEDTGGGGPQSNMNLVPYLMQMALYVINTTRRSTAEERNLNTYLEPKSADQLIDSFYDTEGPLYYLTLAIMLTPYSKWMLTNRLIHLNRIILMAHVHHTNSSIAPNVRSVPLTPHDYTAYKSALMFFVLINKMYECYFKTVEVTESKSWSVSLADYIRHNDEMLLKSSEMMMNALSVDFLPCTSFEELCDAACLSVADPPNHIKNILNTYLRQ